MKKVLIVSGGTAQAAKIVPCLKMNQVELKIVTKASAAMEALSKTVFNLIVFAGELSPLRGSMHQVALELKFSKVNRTTPVVVYGDIKASISRVLNTLPDVAAHLDVDDVEAAQAQVAATIR